MENSEKWPKSVVRQVEKLQNDVDRVLLSLNSARTVSGMLTTLNLYQPLTEDDWTLLVRLLREVHDDVCVVSEATVNLRRLVMGEPPLDGLPF